MAVERPHAAFWSKREGITSVGGVVDANHVESYAVGVSANGRVLVGYKDVFGSNRGTFWVIPKEQINAVTTISGENFDFSQSVI